MFESFAASSTPAAPLAFSETASRPNSARGRAGTNIETAADGGSTGGDVADGSSLAGGSLAGGSLAGGSLAPDSVAGNSGGKPAGAGSVAGSEESAAPASRVIELKTAEDSEIEADVEAARMLLPEPAVPAPDPKRVAIPPEKVRQQVRRPAPRAKRQPLQTLEILPVQPQEASPPSSRPGSRGAGKAKVEAKAKAEQHVAAPAENKDGGDGARTASGALEGNPYRWVVSCVLLLLLFSRVKRRERSLNKESGWPSLRPPFGSYFRLCTAQPFVENQTYLRRKGTPREHKSPLAVTILGACVENH